MRKNKKILFSRENKIFDTVFIYNQINNDYSVHGCESSPSSSSGYELLIDRRMV